MAKIVGAHKSTINCKPKRSNYHRCYRPKYARQQVRTIIQERQIVASVRRIGPL